jgi:predicted aldo/keto reductase-like oxidoreductase
MSRQHRRQFLKNSAYGIMGAAAAPVMGVQLNGRPEGNEGAAVTPRIREYRPLGRTGFKVSDISAGFVNNEAVLNALLDAGVNYIDSAESYNNETLIGNVLKNRDRSKYFVTTKLEIKKDLSQKGFYDRACKCLERLQMDYVDCLMIHSCETVEAVRTTGFHAAMEQLKKEGRLRHVGLSNHGSNHALVSKDSMQDICLAAITDGRFDVLLLAYNFAQEDNGARVLEACHAHDVGATLMKINPYGNYHRLKEYLGKAEKEGKKVHPSYREMYEKFKAKTEKASDFFNRYQLKGAAAIRAAAIRFCLNNPNVSTVCRSFRNFEDVQALVSLSGTRLKLPDRRAIRAFKQDLASFYCHHGCNQCESSCPQQVPVNTVLRYFHYYTAEERQKYAMKCYAQLKGRSAAVCADCVGHCEHACPHGVSTRSMLALAHNKLSLFA